MGKTKAKRSWKHVHKIKVHHNRWLAWAIACAIFACASLVAYIQISEIYFQDELAEELSLSMAWATYRNVQHGYSLKYPKPWALEAGGGTIQFNNPADANEFFSVTVYDAEAASAVRSSLFDAREEEISISGLPGVKISRDRSQPENAIMLSDRDNLYVLRGKTSLFDVIAESFELTEKLERI